MVKITSNFWYLELPVEGFGLGLLAANLYHADMANYETLMENTLIPIVAYMGLRGIIHSDALNKISDLIAGRGVCSPDKLGIDTGCRVTIGGSLFYAAFIGGVATGIASNAAQTGGIHALERFAYQAQPYIENLAQIVDRLI